MKTFAELDFPGRLIAVEGLDGSGKSTQIYLLKRWLELQGLKVFFSEWNSSELVKAATSKGKKRELLTPTTFSLIHATDFADRYERNLVPLLRELERQGRDGKLTNAGEVFEQAEQEFKRIQLFLEHRQVSQTDTAKN